MRRRHLHHLAIWAAWSIPPLFLTVVAVGERKRPISAGWLLIQFLPWYYWALLTIPIVHFATRYPASTLRTRRGVLRHLGTACLAGAGCALVMVLSGHFLHDMPDRPLLQQLLWMLPFWCIFGTIFYGLIAAFAFVREREVAAAQLQARLVEAQLNGLRMQLQPHFLFNTLNTAAMYVRAGDASTSVRVLTRLSELLRRVLDTGATQEVPLALELEHARRFLEIEALRFSDRLEVHVDVPDGLGEALVPNLALQPIIENAIRHGIARSGDRGLLRVSAAREADVLVLSVFNSGPPVDAAAVPSSGIGLQNTRQRLAHMYGDAGKLELRNVDGGVSCELVIPYRV